MPECVIPLDSHAVRIITPTRAQTRYKQEQHTYIVHELEVTQFIVIECGRVLREVVHNILVPPNDRCSKWLLLRWCKTPCIVHLFQAITQLSIHICLVQQLYLTVQRCRAHRTLCRRPQRLKSSHIPHALRVEKLLVCVKYADFIVHQVFLVGFKVR